VHALQEKHFVSIKLQPVFPTKILVCQTVLKKSAVLACSTMSKLKMNQHVPNKTCWFAEKKSA